MDTSPITARSLQKPYHVKGDEFERAYKDFLSGYRTWKELSHADKWLVSWRNIGPNLGIDETSLSDGELYTIVSNKDAHGGKGAIVAIVQGTKVEDVVAALKRILWWERAKVREVTMDFSEGMHSIVRQCFPYAAITVDRFHVQKDCCDAMQQLRVKHRREAQRAEKPVSNTACATRRTLSAGRKERRTDVGESRTARTGDTNRKGLPMVTPLASCWQGAGTCS